MPDDFHDDGIYYLDRYTHELKREHVMAENSLRWVYGSPLGRLSLHLLIKRAIFSKLIGWLKNRPSSQKEIAPFVEEYGINMEESQLGISDFRSFNDFFYRKLKAGARPIAGDDATAVFPADARHMGWEKASDIKQVFVKGQQFDLVGLLGDPELAERYQDGAFVLSRLCPTDYHRFHFPVSGTPNESRRIPGPLASVSPYNLRNKLSWLWTNKREITLVQSPQWGQVAILEVGATGVGGIEQTYTPHQHVQRGDEKGYFYFGGSTVITLFEAGKIRLADDLVQATQAGHELFARQGDAMGRML